MKDIRLNIITPEETLVDEAVDNVMLPGTMGRFEVLKDHAPVITALGKGTVVWHADGSEGSREIRSGFAEVKGNVVTVCVEI